MNAEERRKSELYENMTPLQAVEIVEGDEEADEEDQYVAWQWIADTGLWQHLQGWYGRTVHNLKAGGLIE